MSFPKFGFGPTKGTRIGALEDRFTVAQPHKTQLGDQEKAHRERKRQRAPTPIKSIDSKDNSSTKKPKAQVKGVKYGMKDFDIQGKSMFQFR